MSEHNHTGLDEAVSVASNTLQAVRTGKAIWSRQDLCANLFAGSG